MSDIRVRFATADDASLLLRFIRELAIFEQAPDAVVATEADLVRHGFGPQPQFEAILAFLDGEPAGTRCSTAASRPGLAARGCTSKISMSRRRRVVLVSGDG